MLCRENEFSSFSSPRKIWRFPSLTNRGANHLTRFFYLIWLFSFCFVSVWLGSWVHLRIGLVSETKRCVCFVLFEWWNNHFYYYLSIQIWLDPILRLQRGIVRQRVRGPAQIARSCRHRRYGSGSEWFYLLLFFFLLLNMARPSWDVNLSRLNLTDWRDSESGIAFIIVALRSSHLSRFILFLSFDLMNHLGLGVTRFVIESCHTNHHTRCTLRN